MSVNINNFLHFSVVEKKQNKYLQKLKLDFFLFNEIDMEF